MLLDRGLRHLLPSILIVCAIASPAGALELRGTVRSAKGTPLPDARVSIDSALPRTGVGMLCPWCHPDCAKSVETDRDGRFVLAPLDSTLLFRVLVTSPGFEPRMLEHVDPRAGSMTIDLASRPWAFPRGTVEYHGVVLDPFGFFVTGAMVSPVDGPGAPSITDERGRFVVVGPTDALLVTSRAGAPGRMKDPPRSGVDLNIQLSPGVVIEGLVTRDGAPLPHAVVGLAEQDADLEKRVGPRRTESDEDGRFAFLAVANTDTLRLFGVPDAGGAEAPSERIVTPAAGRHAHCGMADTLLVAPLEWPAAPAVSHAR